MWSAVYEVATTKMKEEADEWKGLMDVSLVFVRQSPLRVSIDSEHLDVP